MKRLIKLEAVTTIPIRPHADAQPLQFFILDHTSQGAALWDLFVGCACVLSSVYYAYCALFDIRESRYAAGSHPTDAVFFGVFALDMLKNFFTDFRPVG